jgi:hypothetical protein
LPENYPALFVEGTVTFGPLKITPHDDHVARSIQALAYALFYETKPVNDTGRQDTFQEIAHGRVVL